MARRSADYQPRSTQQGSAIRRNRHISQKEWERHKDEIYVLYRDQDHSLEQLAAKLERDHAFVASPKQYKSQFHRWGLRKNLNRVHALYGYKEYLDAGMRSQNIIVEIGGKARSRADLQHYLQNNNQTDEDLMTELEAARSDAQHRHPTNISVRRLSAFTTSNHASSPPGTQQNDVFENDPTPRLTSFNLEPTAYLHDNVHSGLISSLNNQQSVSNAFANLVPNEKASKFPSLPWQEAVDGGWDDKLGYDSSNAHLSNISPPSQANVLYPDASGHEPQEMPRNNPENLFYLMSSTPLVADLQYQKPHLSAADHYDASYGVFMRYVIYACIWAGQQQYVTSDELIKTAAESWCFSFLKNNENSLTILSNCLFFLESFGHRDLAMQIIQKVLDLGRFQGFLGLHDEFTATIEFLLSLKDQPSDGTAGPAYDLPHLQWICDVFESQNSKGRLALTAKYHLAWARVQNGVKCHGHQKEQLMNVAFQELCYLKGDCEQVFGEDHMQTISTTATLARVYIHRDLIIPAKSLFETFIIPKLRNTLPDTHPSVLEAKNRLATFLSMLAKNDTNRDQKLNHLQQAESMYKAVLIPRVEYLGFPNPRTQSTFRSLKETLIAQGRTTEAEDLFSWVSREVVKTYGTPAFLGQNPNTINEIGNWWMHSSHA